MSRAASVLPLALLLLGCASPSTRLAWNLKHAEVHKSVRLPQSEVDQIIRTVSRESIFPILVISREKTKRSDRIVVWTDLSHDPQRYMCYELEKQRDGLWHIVWQGNGSIMILDETQ
jgi:hypothetical protein